MYPLSREEFMSDRRERAVRLVRRMLRQRRASSSSALKRPLEAFAQEHPHPKGEAASGPYVFQMLSWFSSRLREEAQAVVEKILTEGYMKVDIPHGQAQIFEEREVSGRLYEVQAYYPSEVKVRLFGPTIELKPLLLDFGKKVRSLTRKRPAESSLMALWIPVRDALSDELEREAYSRSLYNDLPEDRQQEVKDNITNHIVEDFYGGPEVWVDGYKVSVQGQEAAFYSTSNAKGLRTSMTLTLRVSKVEAMWSQ